MCVISLSTAGEPVPTKEQFKQMWDKNPHGAGIVVDLGKGEVMYQKGFMTFDEFMDAYDEIASQHDLVERACAFHFRIKTHGETNAETTHPFLLSPRYQDLRKLEYKGKLPVMMHNGTIPKFGGWLDKLSSDTQDFAGTIGYTMLRKSKRGKKPSKTMLKAADAMLGGSRIVVFYGDNAPVKLGSWTETDGLCTSNSTWKPYQTTYSQTTTPSTSIPVPGSTITTPAVTQISPDQFGMYKDCTPLSSRHWIQYSDKETMKKHTTGLREIIRDGQSFYSLNRFGSHDEGSLFKIDGLEIYTSTGMIARQARDAYFDEIEEEELGVDDTDYIILEEPEDFWNHMSQLDFDMNNGYYINENGDPMYVDYSTNEAYTEKALQAIYGKNFRYAKRDLILNGSMNADWRAPTDEEKRSITHQMRQQAAGKQSALALAS